MKYALLRTLPGRAMVVGAIVKIAVFALGLVSAVPSFVGVVDTVASLSIVAGGLYFVGRGLAIAKRRLLWRVRRKLIISYIFIGVVPAILIVAFFLLGGLLLFSNVSSYLLQSRLQALTQQAASIAATTAIEIQRVRGRDIQGILARRERVVSRDYPGVSLAAVRMNGNCDPSLPPSSPAQPTGPNLTAGAWAHAEPPRTTPGWLACSGFQGLLAYGDESGSAPIDDPPQLPVGDGRAGREVQLLARAVAFPDGSDSGYAVVVDLPLNAALKDRLRADTGVDLASVRTVSSSAPLIAGRPAANAVGVGSARAGAPVSSVSFPEVVDWTTGEVKSGMLLASMQLSIGEIYNRMSAAQGSIANRSFGQGLLLVLMIIGVLFLLIEVLALVVGLALARSITGSVHELFAGTEHVLQHNFTYKIPIRARDQLGELARSFNNMTDSIEELLIEQAEKKRLEEELRIAHEIQMSLLPQGPLSLPGLSVTALCVPAREVGGDYYDVFPLADDRVGVLIADVSGKGTSAALYMAELKGLMLSLSRIHTSPRELLVSANRIIAKHLDARSFITMTYAVLDLRARTMTYARAGHTPIIYLPATGPNRDLRVLAPDGLVVGLKLDQGEVFERLLVEETMAFHEGDLFLLFTDGITEAMDMSDDCFGEVRLGRIIEEHAHLPGEELRERVLREISAFVGDAPQHDDMTMILLRIGDAAAYATPDVAVGATAEV